MPGLSDRNLRIINMLWVLKHIIFHANIVLYSYVIANLTITFMVKDGACIFLFCFMVFPVVIYCLMAFISWIIDGESSTVFELLFDDDTDTPFCCTGKIDLDYIKEK